MFQVIQPHKKFNATSENEGYDYTQKAMDFGQFPDIGTKVLVIFAEGNRGRGYWIGWCTRPKHELYGSRNASTTYIRRPKLNQIQVNTTKTEEAIGTS